MLDSDGERQRTSSGPPRKVCTKAGGRLTKQLLTGTSTGAKNAPRAAISYSRCSLVNEMLRQRNALGSYDSRFDRD